MKLLILYFSGTGNTQYVARYLSRKIEHLPIETQVLSIEQIPPGEVSSFDVLAAGFPTYASDSPEVFREYVAQLPPVENKGAFAFCTKGAYAGNALRRNLKRLMARGYVPLGAESVMMPGSDGLAFVGKTSWMARSAQNKDFGQLSAADRLAQRMEQVLTGMAEGQPAEEHRVPLPMSVSGYLFDWLWALLYESFGKYMKGKFYADERCNNCGLCVQICPAQNIVLDDRGITFLDRCYLCMRCIHQCPQEAIQIGRYTIDKFRWPGPLGEFKPMELRKPAD